MGSSTGLTLANIIVTAFEEEIVKELNNSGIIKFYKRYVEDTLVLTKPSDFLTILERLNSFHPHIQFTLDIFPDNDVHFLDHKIDLYSTTSFRRSTHRLVHSYLYSALSHGQEKLYG